MSSRELIAAAELEMLQHRSFSYFLHEVNPDNGLVIDKTAEDWPASIAATGFALAAYPVAVEHGFMPRAAAVERTLTTLRFFWNSPQGPEPDATGYQGFYYHFLDMRTGHRSWQCELSTIDSAFLLAGAWQQRLEQKWATLHFGEVKVGTRGEQHIFEVQVFLNELDPKAVRVELYADRLLGSAPVRQEMKRVRQLAGASGGYAYSEAVPAARPPSDYPARVIPHCDGVAIPLEDARILWQR